MGAGITRVDLPLGISSNQVVFPREIKKKDICRRVNEVIEIFAYEEPVKINSKIRGIMNMFVYLKTTSSFT